MKKLLALIMAASLVFAVSACGKQNAGHTESDTKIVKGTDAKPSNENNSETNKVTIDDAVDIEIADAKIVDSDDGKAIVVAFNFTNNTSEEKTFDGLFQVTATQDNSKLMGTVVNTDGIDSQSALTMIKPGKTAEVQKVYSLDDNENDVTVEVHEYGSPDKGTAQKVFSVK